MFFLNKNTFSFAEVLFAEHTLSEEIILNEVSLGGSPTIFASLFVVKNAQWRGRKYWSELGSYEMIKNYLRNGKWNWRSFDHYFLAKLTLRCHIPPLLNVSPYSYNQFWCGASYLYGESDVQTFLHFVWWCRAEIMITASYKRGEHC